MRRPLTHLNSRRDDGLLNTWGERFLRGQHSFISELDNPGWLTAVPTQVGSQGRPGGCVWSPRYVRHQSLWTVPFCPLSGSEDPHVHLCTPHHLLSLRFHDYPAFLTFLEPTADLTDVDTGPSLLTLLALHPHRHA